MNRFLLVVALLVAGTALYFGLRPAPSGPGASGYERAYARALAYYLNETNQDDRRARMELQPLAADLSDTVAWRLDMALIDLAEYNHPVQDEGRLLPTPSPHEQLLTSARDHLERAMALDPGHIAVQYNLARAYSKLAPLAEDDQPLRDGARQLLAGLVDGEAADPAALYQYGVLLNGEGDYQGAFEAFDRIVARGKDYVPATLFRVAHGKRAQALLRVKPEEGLAAVREHETMFPDRARASQDALERGTFTQLVPLVPPSPVAADPRAMHWVDVTRRTGLPAAGAPRFFFAPDLDDDCARDVVMQAEDGLRALRNRRDATFEDMTVEAGLPVGFPLAGGAAGDLDNDGRADLVLAGPEGVRIFLNTTDPDTRTSWRFFDYTKDGNGVPRLGDGGGVATTCVVLWDFDHDGDLDLFLGGAVNRVYRTAIETPLEGGKFLVFTDVTEQLGMAAPPADHALLLDVEQDHDVDLLVSGAAGAAWFENLRELRFARRELPAATGLGAGDIDNDFMEEVWLGGAVVDWEDGAWAERPARAFLADLDGDGVFDADPLAGIEPRGAVVAAVGTDLNRDGNADLLLMTDAGLAAYLSRPGHSRGWIEFQPRGLATNEFGIGTRLRLYAADLRQGATCRDGLVSFGTGRRPVVDAVLLRWTNGVEQGVVTPLLAACLPVEEREGEVGSCPFLYTFDGERWHFIADCHSGRPLGLPVADGVYLPPRSDESLLVDGAQLAPVDGRLRLDLAEEFRELFYVDRVVLRAVDRPADVRPVLNEGFHVTRDPEFRVHGFRALRPARRAAAHDGRDLTELLARRDRRHAVVFEKLDGQYEGLAHPWSIRLDFGDLSGAERVRLVMDGWVEFPTASASIAASQSETVHFQPPVLEAWAGDGWVVVEPDAGFPAGKIKSVLVDLTGKLPDLSDVRLRLRSTMRLHWDAFFVTTEADDPAAVRLTEVPLVAAEHKFRGVGRRVEDPDGELPWRYSHDDLETFHRWDQLPRGKLTRYGDVRALLAARDDKYPVLASGDVVELAFDASGLPPLPPGWVRDWVWTTEGWVKDADLNQAVRERVGPLPFHGMSKYPYDEAVERHPHPEWVAEWFTRDARVLVNPAALTGGK